MDIFGVFTGVFEIWADQEIESKRTTRSVKKEGRGLMLLMLHYVMQTLS